MLGFGSDANAVLAAMNRSQAIIEFKLDGTILTANDNFCQAIGYSLNEIVGQHHRMFVDPSEANGAEYAAFWAKLSRGEFDRRQYKRIAKGGAEIWIEASYNPVFKGGKPYKVVKFATDITAFKLQCAEDAGKLSALSRAQAVIEFTPKGEVLTANENFCSVLGYGLSEIKGKHHAMFCDPDYTRSADYQDFWARLERGEFFSDEYLRIGKGGKRVHIQATYNPILDMNGRVCKVVKFATDVTERLTNVQVLAQALKGLADGNLTERIGQSFLPSLDMLRSDYNLAATRLSEAMQAIRANAGTDCSSLPADPAGLRRAFQAHRTAGSLGGRDGCGP